LCVQRKVRYYFDIYTYLRTKQGFALEKFTLRNLLGSFTITSHMTLNK